jgi:hypothetical protein
MRKVFFGFLLSVKIGFAILLILTCSLKKAMKNLHASNELVSAKANSLLRMH